jgi:uroporphyrinogen-III synthase
VAVTFRTKILWITRSAPYCHRDARSFAHEGLRTIAVSVSHVIPIDVPPPESADAIIFTSAHAVHAHPDERRARNLPVFVLGHYAHEAALAAGYRLARSSVEPAGLKDLVASTVPAGARLLIFTSNEGGTTLALDPVWLGYELDRHVVYRTGAASDVELRPALEMLTRSMGSQCIHQGVPNGCGTC